MNLYGYVRNNPIGAIDSLGLTPFRLADEVGGGGEGGEGVAGGEGGAGEGAFGGGKTCPVTNEVPANSQYAKIIPPQQVAQINAGANPMLSTFPGATDAFVAPSISIPTGLTQSELAELAGIPEANVGGIIRLEIPDSQGIASPVNRDIPGFVGGGQTSGGVPEFVVPNQPIGNFRYTLIPIK